MRAARSWVCRNRLLQFVRRCSDLSSLRSQIGRGNVKWRRVPLRKVSKTIFGIGDVLFALATVGQNNQGIGIGRILVQNYDRFFSCLGRSTYAHQSKREFCSRLRVLRVEFSCSHKKRGSAKGRSFFHPDEAQLTERPCVLVIQPEQI